MRAGRARRAVPKAGDADRLPVRWAVGRMVGSWVNPFGPANPKIRQEKKEKSTKERKEDSSLRKSVERR